MATGDDGLRDRYCTILGIEGIGGMFQKLPGAERVCGQRKGSEGGEEEKRVGRLGFSVREMRTHGRQDFELRSNKMLLKKSICFLC